VRENRQDLDKIAFTGSEFLAFLYLEDSSWHASSMTYRAGTDSVRSRVTRCHE
jgi:hypothetical protein